MKNTEKLLLKIPTLGVLDENAEESLNEIFNNFLKIEEYLPIKINDVESLVVGKKYLYNQLAQKSNPIIGGNVGWVNLREGKYAKKWTSSKTYNVNDLVRPELDNGKVYECMIGGISGVQEPLFPVSDNGEVLDSRGVQTWQPEYNYQINEIVYPSNGDTTYFYKCVTSGLTSTTEPTWSTVNGTTFLDGSVVWLVQKTVKWKVHDNACLFRPYGTIG